MQTGGPFGTRIFFEISIKTLQKKLHQNKFRKLAFCEDERQFLWLKRILGWQDALLMSEPLKRYANELCTRRIHQLNTQHGLCYTKLVIDWWRFLFQFAPASFCIDLPRLVITVSSIELADGSRASKSSSLSINPKLFAFLLSSAEMSRFRRPW